MNKRISSVLAICAVVFIFLCRHEPAFARFRTSIQGVVTDPQGAVVPGATLTLKNLSTNETAVRTSNATGVFNFNALPPDHFTLTAEMAGFKKKVLDNLQLIPEQSNALNVELEVGAVSMTTSVDASQAPALDTETANIGGTISSNDIQHMGSTPVFFFAMFFAMVNSHTQLDRAASMKMHDSSHSVKTARSISCCELIRYCQCFWD